MPWDGANGPFSFAPVLHELMLMNDRNICAHNFWIAKQLLRAQGLRTAAFIDVICHDMSEVYSSSRLLATHIHAQTHTETIKAS